MLLRRRYGLPTDDFQRRQKRQHNRFIDTCLLTCFGVLPIQLAFISEKHNPALLLANRQQRGRLSLPPYWIRRLERSPWRFTACCSIRHSPLKTLPRSVPP